MQIRGILRFGRRPRYAGCAAILVGLAVASVAATSRQCRTDETAATLSDDSAVALLPIASPESRPQVQLCQALAPACGGACDPVIYGVDCLSGDGCREPSWQQFGPIPWQAFAHGEYIGPHRMPHVPEYRLRVDDQLDFVYRLTREQTPLPYELNVGDVIRVESLTDANIDRNELVIQPDGSITLRLLGQVQAARRTIAELTADLDERYKKYYRMPSITVTPIRVNTKLEDLRAAIDRRAGIGGQMMQGRVAPDGTVQLVAIGSVPAVGLTLEELKLEIDARYAAVVNGIEVTPILLQRAPRQVFVVGEVRQPGRFVMDGPTTLTQAIALAGGWNVGANLRHVVVFRRAEDWRLVATKLDIRGALFGSRPIPADEIWLRDSDVVIVPKHPLLQTDDLINLVFTRGVYGVLPFGTSYSWGASTL
ncbi:MAG: polysaccharide biosynthesis/export family protein [Planctomycetes bacterium]|nr:polysaccharide biosynthesis/export family protein [Planctomycetota bacterium]